jgi:hypothetical protein
MSQIGMGASLNSMAGKKRSAKLRCKAMQVLIGCAQATKYFFKFADVKRLIAATD